MFNELPLSMRPKCQCLGQHKLEGRQRHAPKKANNIYIRLFVFIQWWAQLTERLASVTDNPLTKS